MWAFEHVLLKYAYHLITRDCVGCPCVGTSSFGEISVNNLLRQTFYMEIYDINMPLYDAPDLKVINENTFLITILLCNTSSV